MQNLRCALLWEFTRRRMVAECQHFGTTYRSHLQRTSSPRILKSRSAQLPCGDLELVYQKKFQNLVLTC